MVALLLVVTGCDKLFGFDQVVVVHDGATDGVSVDAAHACLDGAFSQPFDTGKLDVRAASGGTTDIVAGQVVITWPAGHTSSNYGFVDTQAKFDLSAGEVAIDLESFEGDGADANFYLRAATGYYQISVDLATVLFYVNNGAGDVLIDSMPYGVLPLHLRIYSSGTMVTFEASLAAETFSRQVPESVPLQSVTAGFSAGSYKSAQIAGKAAFDNFLVASPTCP